MKAINRTSAVSQSAERLKEYRQRSDVMLGDKMPSEMTLSNNLCVSRGTVREALRELQARGYVELRPGKGAFVAGKTEALRSDISQWFQNNAVELHSILEVRSALEPLAVHLAIEKCSPEDVRNLEIIQEKSRKAANDSDIEALGRLDEEFHRTIFQIAGNTFLLNINELITAALCGFRSRTFRFPRNVENFIPAHEAILDAFRDGNAKAGEKCMKMHMEKVSADLDNSQSISAAM